MSATDTDTAQENKGNSLYAAFARTTTRSIALYFSRPVRLFRPSKVSGWHSLKGHAFQDGASLTPQYLSRLIRQQGLMIIPRHFFPPILINAGLGTVLWVTYTETSSFLEPHLGSSPTLMASLAGAVAGGMQACVAAPAENVRMALEGGSRGWSHAWKEVFRTTTIPPRFTKEEKMQEIRQAIAWVREVKAMAGRGWEGWGWGFAKDISGFAAFFAIFNITRDVATTTRAVAQDFTLGEDRGQSFKYHFPRAVHGITLVTGGVIAGLAYEFLSRPWDVARRTVHFDRVINTSHRSAAFTVMQKIRDDGAIAFFRDPAPTTPDTHTTNGRRRLYGGLRTLSRVGPWGFGFLAWEAFGTKLD